MLIRARTIRPMHCWHGLQTLVLFLTILALLTACQNGATAPTPSYTGLPPEAAAQPVQASDSGIASGTPAEPAPAPPAGSTAHFDHYSLEEGLSQSVGSSLLQDSRGFLWIGTEDGLNRFDGHDFLVFRNDPDDPTSLSNSHIGALYEDRNGQIWVGTYGGGLDRYDPKTNIFHHHRHDPEDANSLSDDRILAVAGDQDGLIWVGTRDRGLSSFDPTTGAWRHYRSDPQDPDSLSSDIVRAILEDSNGTLWIGTAGGLDTPDPQGGGFDHYRRDPADPDSLSSSYILSLYEDSAGNILIGTANGGLNRLVRDKGSGQVTFEKYRHAAYDPGSLGHDNVRAAMVDPAGNLWVATDAGLDRYDAAKERFIHYRHDPADPRSLSSDSVRALLGDTGGGVWIGTYGGGLNRYDLHREHFVHYKSDPGNPNSLSQSAVWALLEDATGVLWIGTDGGGLNRLDRDSGLWQHYTTSPTDAFSLSNDTVIALYEDRSGGLWVGTGGGGLDRFDPTTETFHNYRYDPDNANSLSNNIIWFVHEDREGDLWIGTQFGLNRFNRITGRFARYYSDPEDPGSLSDNDVGSVLEDRNGTLWFGTHSGLNRYDRTSDSFSAYRHDPDDPNTISHDIVFTLHEDASGIIWLGTWGGGLNRFDPETQTFSHYRVKDGLPNDVIYGILEDAAPGGTGELWLSTNYGLSRFDRETGSFTNYDSRDGLQSNEFSFNGYHRSESGEMFFGGIGGFNAFYPSRVKGNPFVPPVELTALTQGEKRVAPEGNQPARSGVTFEWPDNDFSFEFSALNFYQPEENQHAYRLEGYDASWNYIGPRRFGQYTNLPGGTYTLHMIGSNNDGVWNQEGTSLAVTIVPPFWETWWFRGLAILLAVGFVVGGIRLRLHQVQVRSQNLEREVESRTQELAALNSIASVVSRTLDLQQILDGALAKTLEVTGQASGGIYLLDEEAPARGGSPGLRGRLKIVAKQGLAHELVAGIDNLAVGEGFSGRVAETCEPLVIDNLAADPRLTRNIVQESGFRSVAIAPIVARAQVLGTLFVMSREPQDLASEDIDLLTSIGGQIGTAIQNARYFEAEQRRAEQFRVIAEVGRRITLTPSVQELLFQVAELIEQTFGYYHVGIGLVEGDEVVYRVGAGAFWPGRAFAKAPGRLKVGEEGISGWVAAHGEAVLVPDVSKDPRYVWMQPSETLSELAVPILVKDNVVGVLDIQSDRLNAFDDTDMAVLQSLANQAGAAIENVQLYEQAQQAAVLEERSRLARDLHDAVTQTLFSASLIAEALPTTWQNDPQAGEQLLSELRQLSRGALAEMRTLLLELRPATLVEADLAELLVQLAEAASGREALTMHVDVEPVCDLPPEVHVTIYRITQEALNNIVKHARATRVRLGLHCQPSASERIPGRGPDRVELVVRDDGRGFDPGVVAPERLGLGIMRERADAIGAELEISSKPGSGAAVRLVWHRSAEPPGKENWRPSSSAGRSLA